MSITLCSIMRNASPYVGRYLDQVAELEKLYHGNLRVVLGEGDHTDLTSEQLRLFAPNYFEIVDVSHGGPRYGSIDHQARWDQIATCVRAVLDKVGDPGTALIWVEADLVWSVLDMAALIADLHHVPAVAPRLLAAASDRWYDTWGYRQHGHQFGGQPPYWHEPEEREGKFVKIESCGSCFVASNHAYDALDKWSGHWPARLGGDLWLDTETTVWHP